MQTRKEELIQSLIAYLLDNGLADLSLRPLAAATGTSARLLIYHFESKEGLLTEVLEAMQAHLQQSFALVLTKISADSGDAPPIKRFWTWAIAEKNYPYLKLLYELQILAIQNPDAYAQYLKRNSSSWFELVQHALPASEQSPALVTLCSAVFDGLFIELISTGDRKRTTQALDLFIHTVQQARASATRA